jgi:hypothetical protein
MIFVDIKKRFIPFAGHQLVLDLLIQRSLSISAQLLSMVLSRSSLTLSSHLLVYLLFPMTDNDTDLESRHRRNGL